MANTGRKGGYRNVRKRRACCCKAMGGTGCISTKELTDLPNEMLEQIFNYLDYTSLKSISAVENPRISAIAERRLLSIENSLKRINSFLGKSISPENRLAALQGAWHARPLNRLDVYAFEPAFNSIMNDIDNLSLKSRATYIKSTYKFSKDFGVIKDLTPISHQNAYSTVNKGMAYLLRSVDFNNV
ncbi:F-box protein [Pantoea stewartii]